MASPLPWSDLAPILVLIVLIVPMVVLYSISTFGEEAAWRGYLQNLLAGRGFWAASAIVSTVWVLFHLPLHGTLALQGTLPVDVLAASTLLLFPTGLFLSAAVRRFGSVWPAVFAHALPMSALNLLQHPGDLASGTLRIITALIAIVLTAAAVLLGRGAGVGHGIGSRAGSPFAQRKVNAGTDATPRRQRFVRLRTS
ncbi:CPBP family intramembrane glutamic endopeptidase [Planctomonas psychrotolerans]|uniref:CPBP family intramembrane glutamic endopeptidase n=1 Tax=Planctomonas psychrotolerans TaxID=2528712 RepID=UPI0012386820|nr:CPBP family intramembrane glutamic endopeptidase [Planctomonas psychrotolerans]